MGRPAIDDREQVLAFFQVGLKKGKTINEIAQDGLTIISAEKDSAGRWTGQYAARHLEPPTLRRRYRMHRAEQDRLDDPATTLRRMGLKQTFFGRFGPRATLSFGSNPDLKAGRPRKKMRR